MRRGIDDGDATKGRKVQVEAAIFAVRDRSRRLRKVVNEVSYLLPEHSLAE